MKTQIALLTLALVGVNVMAKLPPPSDEEKAKAAEAASKAAWSGKVDGYRLCLVQDRLAANYLQQAQAAGKQMHPVSTPACSDPGAYASAPAAVPPIEAAGAHSPPATAVAPPSTTQPAATQGAKP